MQEYRKEKKKYSQQEVKVREKQILSCPPPVWARLPVWYTYLSLSVYSPIGQCFHVVQIILYMIFSFDISKFNL